MLVGKVTRAYEDVEHCPERGEISLTMFQQAKGGYSNLSLLGKSTLEMSEHGGRKAPVRMSIYATI